MTKKYWIFVEDGVTISAEAASPDQILMWARGNGIDIASNEYLSKASKLLKSTGGRIAFLQYLVSELVRCRWNLFGTQEYWEKIPGWINMNGGQKMTEGSKGSE